MPVIQSAFVELVLYVNVNLTRNPGSLSQGSAATHRRLNRTAILVLIKTRNQL